MGPVRLAVGTQWLLDGRAWRIIRQLAPDRFVAQDVKFHVEQEFSQQEIHSHYAEGRLRFEGEPTASATKNHPSAKSGESWSAAGRPSNR